MYRAENSSQLFDMMERGLYKRPKISCVLAIEMKVERSELPVGLALTLWLWNWTLK